MHTHEILRCSGGGLRLIKAASKGEGWVRQLLSLVRRVLR